jgi:PAP2 superfamily.
MISLKPILKKDSAIIIPYSVFLIGGIIILLIFSKVTIHLFINRLNTPFFDYFFKYLTQFGAFLLIGPIILILALVKYRFALIAAVSSTIASLLVQVLKRVADTPRPKVVFEHLIPLHVVDNVRLHSMHSFPSGHTAGAFALFIVLALITRHPTYKFLFLTLAILVGYSRMYLSQHFLIDVEAGSFVGTVSAFGCFYWLNNKKYRSIKYLDGSILTSLKAKKH